MDNSQRELNFYKNQYNILQKEIFKIHHLLEENYENKNKTKLKHDGSILSKINFLIKELIN